MDVGLFNRFNFISLLLKVAEGDRNTFFNGTTSRQMVRVVVRLRGSLVSCLFECPFNVKKCSLLDHLVKFCVFSSLSLSLDCTVV